MLLKGLWFLTVGEGDLDGLGGVSEVPHGQAAVWVAAHELLALVVPADWMDRLFQQHREDGGWGGGGVGKMSIVGEIVPV